MKDFIVTILNGAILSGVLYAGFFMGVGGIGKHRFVLRLVPNIHELGMYTFSWNFSNSG